MSDPATASGITAGVMAALATYDTSHNPLVLRDAGDQLVREDGVAGADPAASLVKARERLQLALAVLSRFRRDLDPKFDPNHPPPLVVAPPPVGGAQLMPGVRPSDVKDPAARAQYEADIAANGQRIEQFKTQLKLHEVHETVLDQAAGSLEDAHHILGLSTGEIVAALDHADILPEDRAKVLASVTP